MWPKTTKVQWPVMSILNTHESYRMCFFNRVHKKQIHTRCLSGFDTSAETYSIPQMSGKYNIKWIKMGRLLPQKQKLAIFPDTMVHWTPSKNYILVPQTLHSTDDLKWQVGLSNQKQVSQNSVPSNNSCEMLRETLIVKERGVFLWTKFTPSNGSWFK